MTTVIRRLLQCLNKKKEPLVITAVYLSDIVLRNIVDCSLMLVLCSEMFDDDKLRPVKNF